MLSREPGRPGSSEAGALSGQIGVAQVSRCAIWGGGTLAGAARKPLLPTHANHADATAGERPERCHFTESKGSGPRALASLGHTHWEPWGVGSDPCVAAFASPEPGRRARGKARRHTAALPRAGPTRAPRRRPAGPGWPPRGTGKETGPRLSRRFRHVPPSAANAAVRNARCGIPAASPAAAGRPNPAARTAPQHGRPEPRRICRAARRKCGPPAGSRAASILWPAMAAVSRRGAGMRRF